MKLKKRLLHSKINKTSMTPANNIHMSLRTYLVYARNVTKRRCIYHNK